jgi:predicted Rossmann-fold nucleotide-binding protein
MGEARNTLIISFAEAVIAIGGEWGTLSEIAFAMRIGRPIVLLAPTFATGPDIQIATSPDEAVQRALAAARMSRTP